MDSLTQIVLGAAVGEAVLGKKIGNKAMLYGAIAGTIPDLDVFVNSFTDTVSAIEIHRGFTHSILFSILFAPIFGWLVSRFERYKSVKDWSWLFFWCLLTHPLLDSFTTWGTQLFWPLNTRVALKTIFVIDPLYTVPFIVFLILAMFQKRTSKKRRFYNNMGLIVSTCYLVITLLLKWFTYTKFEEALIEQNIAYTEIDTRPSPMNTILWSANVATKDAFLIGSYSLFDSQPIIFNSYPKNHELIADFTDNLKMQRMISISNQWYCITEKNDELYFNDLRFGLLSMEPDAQDFVFQYKFEINENGDLFFTETEKDRGDAEKLLKQLWERIKGN
ncbi:putative membrane-bound metal-dependent hydrolase [Galbibacter marinus]|uniref:Putative membrane-bound metal-dependent hydrolase n=1 Tax=Galbibacter marinus TaxID=555500 RepID=K2P4K2_9FLAO|nr:metal-dependent hydrolase [Galbibacter marinus]EKF55953.1 putative membrane-bound metal-dependent hydrolase [Galbibacter marinus]